MDRLTHRQDFRKKHDNLLYIVTSSVVPGHFIQLINPEAKTKLTSDFTFQWQQRHTNTNISYLLHTLRAY